ncbi:tetrahydrofolate dehydrogenase/cyclohydrolase catalytic domain-containing protein [Halobaculum limi]|uniref:tetrahydrofolate dehydrogenase/cyclohydrolase catalytic domain-containing protein n=1 Tax=Halobaculum limi TaxID=3031916 RepID=UPI002405AA2E|nr:tetrahydrofolate dehydrogenase/cyclohydrolase catalytic domain-containing protein [Halobaculum sp. YSMS11]
MTDIDGNAVAADIRSGVAECVETLQAEGVDPALATVLMSDDPASETYVSMKQNDCEEVGIDGIHVDVDDDAPAEELYDTIDELNADDGVHGILVQLPVPDHVDTERVLRSIDPAKDVDGFHPENVGRLVGGNARFKPCTPHGIQRLLAAADVDPEGKEAVVVGRSDIVGKPIANLLFGRGPGGNATTTVCHSRTDDLASHTRRADIVVAAAGIPEFITADMVSEGTTVIDVGINRVERDGESTLVGDVDYEAVSEKAGAITPVPGGVGPMTRAMLLYNTVKAAAEQHDVDVDLP